MPAGCPALGNSLYYACKQVDIPQAVQGCSVVGCATCMSAPDGTRQHTCCLASKRQIWHRCSAGVLNGLALASRVLMGTAAQTATRSLNVVPTCRYTTLTLAACQHYTG